MVNVPGAIYRSAWHANFTLELISDEIERISGYPAANFIASKKRTLWSILHPDDRPKIQEALNEARDDGEPFGLEYRIIRADGEVRWVLDRGQLVSGSGGRLWCDGAMFDVTERRAAEEAARAREIDRARSEELHASRARIVEAADAARRKIERDLHDGAQQRLVALALEVRMARSAGREGPGPRRPVPRAGRPGADRRLGRAARARARHPPGRADRARPGAGDLGARLARPLPSTSSSCRRTGCRRPPRRPPTSRSPRR